MKKLNLLRSYLTHNLLSLKLVKALEAVTIIAAIVVCLIWLLWERPDDEPIAVILVIAATVLRIYLEPKIRDREERLRLLTSTIDEFWDVKTYITQQLINAGSVVYRGISTQSLEELDSSGLVLKERDIFRRWQRRVYLNDQTWQDQLALARLKSQGDHQSFLQESSSLQNKSLLVGWARQDCISHLANLGDSLQRLSRETDGLNQKTQKKLDLALREVLFQRAVTKRYTEGELIQMTYEERSVVYRDAREQTQDLSLDQLSSFEI